MDLPNEVKRACKVLDISPKQVMACRVEKDHVVIIEGPVGYKRIVTFAVMAEFEAQKEAEALAEKRARTEARKGKKK